MAVFFVMAGIGTGFCAPRTPKALAAAKEGDQETARKLMEPVDKVAVPGPRRPRRGRSST